LARYVLADFYRRAGRNDLAEAELLAAVRQFPKEANPLMTLGISTFLFANG